MNPELVHRASDDARARQFAAVDARRNAEANDAMDFRFGFDVMVELRKPGHPPLVVPEAEVAKFDGPDVVSRRSFHDPAKCVHALAGGTPCSRDYDPAPYAEAEPADTRMYEGTGIGALYGLPGGEAHLWQLAGWNLVRDGSL